MTQIIRSILMVLLALLLLTGAPRHAQAGLISSGIKTGIELGKSGLKALKRQFPSGVEKELLRSGTRATFQGRKVIKRNNTFDTHTRDGLGRTNRQRMEQGRAPIGRDGVEVQLHHHQQRNQGPIIEMTATEHRSLSRDLHRYTRESEIDRREFNIWKQEYWRARAKGF